MKRLTAAFVLALVFAPLVAVTCRRNSIPDGEKTLTLDNPGYPVGAEVSLGINPAKLKAEEYIANEDGTTSDRTVQNQLGALLHAHPDVLYFSERLNGLGLHSYYTSLSMSEGQKRARERIWSVYDAVEPKVPAGTAATCVKPAHVEKITCTINAI